MLTVWFNSGNYLLQNDCHTLSGTLNLKCISEMAMIGFSVKAVQLPSAILNVKELGGKCMTSKLLLVPTVITLKRSQL